MLLEAINISYNFPIRKKMHFLCYGCKLSEHTKYSYDCKIYSLRQYSLQDYNIENVHCIPIRNIETASTLRVTKNAAYNSILYNILCTLR